MRMTQRARNATIALVAATAIGASGVAVGAAAAAPAPTPNPAANASAAGLSASTGTARPGTASTAPAASAAAPGTQATVGAERASYADVVRRVLPSVVLISTTEGLGSGVVLDKAGNIVTNAHVAGGATDVPGPGRRGHRAAQRAPGGQLPARRPGRHPGR